MRTKGAGEGEQNDESSATTPRTKRESARARPPQKKLFGTMSRSWDLAAYRSRRGFSISEGPTISGNSSREPKSRRKDKLRSSPPSPPPPPHPTISGGVKSLSRLSRFSAFATVRPLPSPSLPFPPALSNGSVETGSATISPMGSVTFLFTRRAGAACQVFSFLSARSSRRITRKKFIEPR